VSVTSQTSFLKECKMTTPANNNASDLSILPANEEIADEILEETSPVNFMPVWGRIGSKVVGAKSSADAIIAANLNWNVIMAQSGFMAKNNQTGIEQFCSSGKCFMAIIRSDTFATLGNVTQQYKTIQNSDAFSFLDSLLDSGAMTIETAGALDGGKKVWILANLPQVDEVADGDTSKRYLLFSNSHNGTSAVRCLPTSIRVVCQNTLALALKQGDGEGITIKHSGDINEKLSIAKDTLKLTMDIFDRNLTDSRKLVEKKLSQDDVIGYMDRIFPLPANTGNSMTIRKNLRETLLSNFYTHPLQQIPSIKQSAYALVNAVTQNVDHGGRTRITKGKTEGEAQFTNAIFGTGAKLKREAFDIAMNMFAA
jgi:phage/plasmid-like protein (TIGR03299 family)